MTIDERNNERAHRRLFSAIFPLLFAKFYRCSDLCHRMTYSRGWSLHRKQLLLLLCALSTPYAQHYFFFFVGDSFD